MQTLEQRRRTEQQKRKKRMYGYWWLHQNDKDLVENMRREFATEKGKLSAARVYQVISEFIEKGEPQV